MSEVHEGLTLIEEAQLFLRLNGGRSAVRVFDKFKARLVAKEPVAIAIVAVLKSLGLKIVKAQQKHGVCAIKAVEGVYHRGNLERTMAILTDWADGDPEAYETQLVKAMSAFLEEYPNAPTKEIVKKLQDYAPGKVTARLRRTQKTFECSTREAACIALRDIYNERRPKRMHLPPLGRQIEDDMPIAAE